MPKGKDKVSCKPNVSIFDGQQSPPPNLDDISPQNGPSNQSTGISASRGARQKRNMVDLMEAQFDKMDLQIMALVEGMKDSNSISDKLHQVIESQVEVAEK
ncbi:hypothetical protein E2542_SST05357 [Spatholobus suberectus]|nr:hypothetical protein E2542_SST05357 [Spatholobus suberectus]